MYRQPGQSFWSMMPPVTKNLIIINFLIWIAMVVSPKIQWTLSEYCALHYAGGSDFNPAQLFTYMFMHDTHGLTHVAFNMFTLFMFGITLEQVVGSRRFLFFYISCGIGAALIQEAVWACTVDSMVNNHIEMVVAQFSSDAHISVKDAYAMIPEAQLHALRLSMENALTTVGASGAVYGILLAFGMIFPNRPLFLLFLPVPIKAKWMVIGYGVIELMLGVFSSADGIAHFAHLGGMIFGVLIILYWKRHGVLPRHGGYY